MEFGYKFRSSLFGFSKKDVILCIKELNEAHQQTVVELEERCDKAERERDVLNVRLSESHEAVVAQKRALEENQKKTEALETVVRRLVDNRSDNEREISQLKERVTLQNSQNAELLLKNNELSRKLGDAAAKVEKYDALSKDISDAMLEARRMSLHLKEEAGEEAMRIVENAKDSTGKVRTDLDRFQRQIGQISRTLEQLTERLREEVGRIERSFAEVNESMDALEVPETYRAEEHKKVKAPAKKADPFQQAVHKGGAIDFFGKFKEWLK